MNQITAPEASDKSFFTFATGAKYLSLAFSLARSYRLTNGLDIPFCIASDSDFNLPTDLKWVKKIIVSRQTAGHALEFKLNLLDIAPTQLAIFIDADSLIYDNINFLFEKFKGTGVNVIGTKVTDGTWVDEHISETCKEFDLEYVIRYCGAFYYMEKNEKGQQIFDYAHSLYRSKRHFQRTKFTIYDEPILSIAMSKHKVEPLTDDGNIWGDLVQFNYSSQLNIIKGPAVFNNDPAKSNYKFWLPTGKYQPKIIHVGSGNHNRKPWLFDALRLKFYNKLLLPLWAANLVVNIFVIPVYSFARTLSRIK